MSPSVRLGADRLGRPACGLLAVVASALAFGLAGCDAQGPSGAAGPRPTASLLVPAGGRRSGGSTYTLMQMNLCLSGLARCYDRAVVQEAVARIREARPDAVTFNEACGNDAALIARRTGYHLWFSTVIYGGRPLSCIKPEGRGRFGDAVLTKAGIERTESRAFEAQAGPERRRWLCVATRVGVDVCTAHLASAEIDEVTANGPQCAELRTVLAHRAAAHAVIFAGDLNRRPSCAPKGFWIRTDRSADQNPGLQQAYGSGALRSPAAGVVRARRTDHAILLVRAHLAGRH